MERYVNNIFISLRFFIIFDAIVRFRFYVTDEVVSFVYESSDTLLTILIFQLAMLVIQATGLGFFEVLEEVFFLDIVFPSRIWDLRVSNWPS
jgi:hypothetical protein